jgi:membrane protein YqaA with SNARE-associated domain
MDFNWHQFVLTYGLWGLGGASFVSATIIPLSSEAILIAGIAAGLPFAPAFAVCSVGNCLACACNYGLGAVLRPTMLPRLTASRSGRKAIAWMERWGLWSLLASWLPFVGDPLTVVAGTARVHILWFAVIVFALRILRYVAALYGAHIANIL